MGKRADFQEMINDLAEKEVTYIHTYIQFVRLTTYLITCILMIIDKMQYNDMIIRQNYHKTTFFFIHILNP